MRPVSPVGRPGSYLETAARSRAAGRMVGGGRAVNGSVVMWEVEVRSSGGKLEMKSKC